MNLHTKPIFSHVDKWIGNKGHSPIVYCSSETETDLVVKMRYIYKWLPFLATQNASDFVQTLNCLKRVVVKNVFVFFILYPTYIIRI